MRGLLAKFIFKGADECAMGPFARVEEPCLQIPEDGAHFIEDRGAIVPDFSREIEEFDLASKRVLDRTTLGGRGELTRE